MKTESMNGASGHTRAKKLLLYQTAVRRFNAQIADRGLHAVVELTDKRTGEVVASSDQPDIMERVCGIRKRNIN